MIQKRTFEDFVEDMICRGRTEKEILTVAFMTQWVGFLPEIKAHIKKLNKFFKKPKQNH